MKRGFTMLELMLAVLILSIMTIVSVWTFRSIVRNWELATEMADNMQRVDYALAQVTSALRSAYFPTGGNTKDEDGRVVGSYIMAMAQEPPKVRGSMVILPKKPKRKESWNDEYMAGIRRADD